MTVAAVRTTPPAPKTSYGFVDCDVHNGMGSPEELRKYLPAKWHKDFYGAAGMPSEHFGDTGATFTPEAEAAEASAIVTGKKKKKSPGIWLGGAARVASSMYHVSRQTNGAFRWDARPPAGGLPGTDFDFLVEDLLNTWPVEKAILTPRENGGWPQAGKLSGALNAALNDWMIEEWLERDPRMYGCINIPQEDGKVSAAEIVRAAPYKKFVQVEMVVKSRDPMGHARYWPIYEAAEAAGLPVSVHAGGGAPNPSTSAGWPSYHYEFRNGQVQAFESQAVSLLGSGVFKAFPKLKIILVEGGFTWMAPLMWRMDRAWELMGKDVTHLDEPPSTILKRHIYFTTQPMDQSENPAHMQAAIAYLERQGYADNIMFSTDYPHWDFDAPDHALDGIPNDLKEKIYRRNAEAVFRFEPAKGAAGAAR